MGGKKKLSIAQVERQQLRTDEKERKKAKGDEKKQPRGPPGIMVPNASKPEVLDAIARIKALTPYVVAKQFNIRISTAKALLKTFEANGAVKMVSGSHAIKIYAPKAQ